MHLFSPPWLSYLCILPVLPVKMTWWPESWWRARTGTDFLALVSGPACCCLVVSRRPKELRSCTQHVIIMGFLRSYWSLLSYDSLLLAETFNDADACLHRRIATVSQFILCKPDSLKPSSRQVACATSKAHESSKLYSISSYVVFLRLQHASGGLQGTVIIVTYRNEM